MVQDMINDPENSHGILFKLTNEQYYRRMLFASSDNLDPKLHPELTITYETPTDLNKIENSYPKINVFPNPATSTLNISFDDYIINKEIQIEIFNAIGQRVIAKNSTFEKLIQLDISNFTKGNHYLKITQHGHITTKSICFLP